MVAALRSLLVSVSLAAVARMSSAVGAVIRCEPCDAGARTLCDPVPEDCVERVREPGCGCCVTCALAEGRACGVYTGRCGAGLVCRHRPGETRPLHALLEGRGVCVNKTAPPPVSAREGRLQHVNNTRIEKFILFCMLMRWRVCARACLVSYD